MKYTVEQVINYLKSTKYPTESWGYVVVDSKLNVLVNKNSYKTGDKIIALDDEKLLLVNELWQEKYPEEFKSAMELLTKKINEKILV